MSHFGRLGIIGGSGLGELLLDGLDPSSRESHVVTTPFGPPSGEIVTGSFEDAPIAMLARHGDGHVLNPNRVPYRANIFALKELGCTHVVASGACGSLREEIEPGDVVVCDQLIDRTDGRPRTFFEKAAVHVEFADPFCPVLRAWLLAAGGTRVRDGGTYVCMEGPSFSTRAESTLHRQWGADVVGMTALPEARLAREAEMAYALIALPTDYDSWRPRATTDDDSLLQEIIGNLNRATDGAMALLREALASVEPLASTPSPAHHALRLAVWSDRTKADLEAMAGWVTA